MPPQKNTKKASMKQNTFAYLAMSSPTLFFSKKLLLYLSTYNLSELLWVKEIKNVAFDLNPSLSCRCSSVIQ